MPQKLWIVDAFTLEPFKGNPAAVMIVESFPSDVMCQKIAGEINLSETAFVKPLSDGLFHIKWFTPAVEVALCGHATLAASHILFQEKIAKNAIVFESLSGRLFVTKNDDNRITLNFPLQKTGPGLDKRDLQSIFPCGTEIINYVKAFDDVIVELASPENVQNLILDPKKVEHIPCRGLIVTAKGNKLPTNKNESMTNSLGSLHTYDFVSRFFCPNVGVDEDPVTGSAHCKLAHYWQEKLQKNSFIAYQASRRGGILYIEYQNDRVLLSGHAVTVIEGTCLPYLSA